MNQHETDRRVASSEQIIDFQYQIGRAFRNMPLARAKAILGNKKELQKMLQKISKELELPLVSENVFAQIPMLEKYFSEVYGLTIDLSQLMFPENDALPAFMAVPPQLSEDAIMEAIQKFCAKKNLAVDLYRYKNPAAENIDRTREQRRPSGLYIFAHSGEDEPDAKYRGKSYDDATALGFPFASAKEYLLMTGFHKFVKGYFMDKKGWTRTSSLWSDGYLVGGGSSADGSKLNLYSGFVDDRDPDDGVRELFLLS